MKIPIIVMACLVLAGCAGGPPKDYYSPMIQDPPHFQGPLSIEPVEDFEASKKELIGQGYTLIGMSVYGSNEQPKAIEFKAQANRIHATKVIFTTSAAPPGSWEVHVGLLNGGHSGAGNVKIAYFGK